MGASSTNGSPKDPNSDHASIPLMHAPNMAQPTLSDDSSPAAFVAVPKTIGKHVSFDCLHIREYPVILGDHPSTSSGLPVTLDWIATNSYQLKVNQYEKAAVRRAKLELRMPPEVRRELLHGGGNDDDTTTLQPEDMRRVTRDVRRAKDQRAQSIAMQEFESLYIFFESAARKWKRWRVSWNEDTVEDPATTWLRQWQQEKKLNPKPAGQQRKCRSRGSILKDKSLAHAIDNAQPR